MEIDLYNTGAGIQASLHSLEAFHAMLAARREAAAGQPVLNQFVVLGRYRLDQFGQVHFAAAPTPKDVQNEIPDVITYREFGAHWSAGWVAAHNGFPSWSMGGGRRIAPHGALCAMCQQSWNVANAHDCSTEITDVIVPLAQFVGQPIGSAFAKMTARTDAAYQPYPNGSHVRNVRNITADNKRGWCEIPADQIDTYIVQEGDEVATMKKARYFHGVCHAGKLAVRTETEFSMLFERAGFNTVSMLPVANQYGSQSYRGPWYEVQTEIGLITIGWRKRVMDISWASILDMPARLFPDIDNTQDSHNIHAWTHAEAVTILSRLREAMTTLAEAFVA